MAISLAYPSGAGGSATCDTGLQPSIRIKKNQGDVAEVEDDLIFLVSSAKRGLAGGFKHGLAPPPPSQEDDGSSGSYGVNLRV